MKKYFSLALFTVLTSSQAFAVNLSGFHRKNFEAVGNYCGFHAEVSGNHLILTNIIQPSSTDPLPCGPNGSQEHCQGKSFLLTCNTDGRCFNSSGDFAVLLLDDGNLFNDAENTKYLRTAKSEYQWCK